MDYLLTNTWTHAAHGHARGEIRQIKDYLAKSNAQSEIISISPEFGECSNFSLGNLAHNLKFDHTRFLKKWVDRRLIQDLERNLLSAVGRKRNTKTKIIITSARFGHVLQLKKITKIQNDLHIRLLDSPNSDEEWQNLKLLVNESESRVKLAFEFRPTAEMALKYIDGVSHVPAAQSLTSFSEKQIIDRNRLGIFFPVGRKSMDNKIEFFLEALSEFYPYVKLPDYIDSRKFIQRYPKVIFMPRDLPNNMFDSILNQIKVGVLGHENYVNQSSAYASYFASKNVPVIVSENNAFFSEFRHFNFHDIPGQKALLRNLVKKLMKEELNLEQSPYSFYASQAWESFLEIEP